MSNPDLHSLPRLDRASYQAFAAVHWTMKIEPSAPGWLTREFHEDFRTILVHACAREKLLCPAYCLMPDHLHLMWLGLSLASDQLNAMRFLRTYLNRLLDGKKIENRRSAVVPQESAVDSEMSAVNSQESAVNSRSRPRIKWELQPQAYDHVLREEERKQNAFAQVCFYILANPVRADLVKGEKDWPFGGAVVPGYPDLYPFQEDYWELFWKIYARHRESTPIDPPK